MFSRSPNNGPGKFDRWKAQIDSFLEFIESLSRLVAVVLAIVLTICVIAWAGINGFF